MIATLLGLVLFSLVLFVFLPRLVGGLLGRGQEVAANWSGAEWDMEAVIWEPREMPDDELAQSADPESITEDEVMEEMSHDLVQTLLEEEEGITEEISPPASAGGGNTTPPPSTAAGGGPNGGQGRLTPRIKYQEWPDQKLVRELAESGSFHFRLRVGSDGLVTTYQLLKGFECRECLAEAERIIATLEFTPGSQDGYPVACWVQYEIEFRRDGG